MTFRKETGIFVGMSTAYATYHIPAGTKAYRRTNTNGRALWVAVTTTKDATFNDYDLLPVPATTLEHATKHCARCHHGETFHLSTSADLSPIPCAKMGCSCKVFVPLDTVYYFQLPPEAAPWTEIAVEASSVTLTGEHVEPVAPVSQSSGRNHVGSCGALGTSADLWSGK